MKRLRAGISTTKKNASATVSCVNSMIRHDENGKQEAMTHSVQPSLSPGTQMQVQQQSQVTAPLPAPSQPARGQVQVLAAPVQVKVSKPKTVEKPQPQKKRLLAIANSQHGVMSGLAPLLKNGKLCDAGIGNGSSTVKVHKLVLSAVCPKLVSVFNMDTMSNEFLQVNFPETVSKEALNAFAEYMYNSILDLDRDILEQLKIIAKRLDMKEFEELCDLLVRLVPPSPPRCSLPYLSPLR